MSHLEVGDLVALQSQRVGAEESARMQEHLATCSECTSKLANLPHLPQTQDAELRTPTLGPPPALPPVKLPRGATIGRFMVVSTLGEGGMGVVYAAYDPELDRRVAIKLLQADKGSASQAW